MNLASCQTIKDLKPIEGADLIETATVLGWEVVVKKGEYNIGDKCCYIGIDTVVPATEQFSFLEARNYRVRTIKLKKQLSQGLIIPLPAGRWKEGDDLTEVIGVKKYEKPDNNPIERYEKPRKPKGFWQGLLYYFKYNYLYKWFPSLRQKLRSPFPTHLVSITDEERIQNCPSILNSHKGKEFIISYKLDGSSITIIHNKKFGRTKYRICSRRFELHDKKNDWYRVFAETGFSKHIDELVKWYSTDDIIVQGEAIGKFNGNHHGLEQDEIRLFNIYVDGKRLKQDEFYGVCSGLNIPVCDFHSKTVLNHSLQELLSMSDIPDKINPKVPVEGLVWRCIEDNTSFKAINNSYLLKEK